MTVSRRNLRELHSSEVAQWHGIGIVVPEPDRVDSEPAKANNPSAFHLIAEYRPMLASFIHCLTLVAFGAHVLLGCCAHHHHDVSSALCSQHHGHVHDAGEQHDDHNHEPAESDSHDLVVKVDADHPATPCDHSHDCEQGDCTFVSSDSRVVPPASSDMFVLMPSHASTSADVRRFLDVVRSDNLSTCCLLVGHRCALQQSWQI